MFTFRAMSTDVAVSVPLVSERAEGEAAKQVAAVFDRSERRFSRFRVDSELSWLNRASGPVEVSAELFEALWRARAYVECTDGVFDPGVGADLAALGYDRSFVPGGLDRDFAGPGPARGSLRDVRLDPTTRTVTRPPHVHIDLGGMVKGSTVDRAARLLPDTSAIDAGGDAVLRGAGPDGSGWPVDVEDPFDPTRTLLTLFLRDRAVATTAPNRRRWRVGDREVHHVIDPRIRRPASPDIAQATVVAGTAELADVLAKTVFVLGRRAGRRLLARYPDVGGVLVGHDGAVSLVGMPERDHA